MVLNQRLMNCISEKEVIAILKYAQYDNYLESKYNRNNSSYFTNCQDLVNFDAFENYIANLLLHDPYKIDRQLMVNYRDYLYKVFKKVPNIVFESLMFNRELAPLLFINNQLQEIEIYKKNSNIKCKEIYEKIKQGKNVTVKRVIFSLAF